MWRCGCVSDLLILSTCPELLCLRAANQRYILKCLRFKCACLDVLKNAYWRFLASCSPVRAFSFVVRSLTRIRYLATKWFARCYSGSTLLFVDVYPCQRTIWCDNSFLWVWMTIFFPAYFPLSTLSHLILSDRVTGLPEYFLYISNCSDVTFSSLLGRLPSTFSTFRCSVWDSLCLVATGAGFARLSLMSR